MASLTPRGRSEAEAQGQSDPHTSQSSERAQGPTRLPTLLNSKYLRAPVSISPSLSAAMFCKSTRRTGSEPRLMLAPP